ncbi:RES family NAD+ phosphorylase [Aquiflexum sp.]|uniref:RES family NAD+ phosphorylase n=1 Tax=Aquiflexum sp. TaxID=1872584 RepID=UPI0035944896
MLVFRICLEKYAYNLIASGKSNRWNSSGNFVIYTSSNRALACLENVVHRSSEGLNSLFKVMVIQIDDEVQTTDIPEESLPENWHKKASYSLCQKIGDDWYREGKTAVLAVPSSIIPKEKVYIINTRHPYFLNNKIRLISIEDFVFSPRIKSENPDKLE